MKHLPALVAALILLACAPSSRIPESIVTVQWQTENDKGELETYNCTGFAVTLASVLTAEHCVPPVKSNADVLVDGKQSRILKRDEAMALLSMEPMSKLPLPIADSKRRVIGERLWSWGHAYSGPLMVIGRLVAGYDGEHLIVDGPIAQGMSGGPIVNDAGEVVGINQATSAALGIACTAKEIRDFLK
jgi:hypothetical protein